MGLFFKKAESQKDRKYVSAIIVAAGNSKRMGTDKIFAELCDIPVIVHTIRRFEFSDLIDEIIVVSRPEKIIELKNLCKAFELTKVKKIVKGGNTRTESVMHGVMEAAKQSEFIAVHDGARPLITTDLINLTVKAAIEYGAAAPGVVPKESVKLTNDGFCEQNIDREHLVLIQTPQIFDAALIKGALIKVLAEGINCTDECSAVEHIGFKVKLCSGEYENIKLTTPEDMAIANSIIKSRGVI